MTPQEKELLSAFLQQLTSAQAGQKDPEAEALIRDAVARQPDAAYLLVQRALQLDQALQMTQAQVRELQTELAQSRAPARGGTSFLSDTSWGSKPATAVQQNAPAQRTPGSAPLGAPPLPGNAAAPMGAARPSPWGGSSMLGTVATTAAGVVAGSFLFQGIQNLMHRNDAPAAQGALDSQAAAAHGSDGFTNPGDELRQVADMSDEGADTYAAGDDSGDFA